MGTPRHKAEVLRLEDWHSALELKEQYPYALLYCYSEVVLCETSELTDKVWDECREARFFGQEAELHIFPDEGRAVLVTDNEDSDGSDLYILDRSFELNKRFGAGRWSSVKVRYYLADDEDGQMRIALTRLAGLQ